MADATAQSGLVLLDEEAGTPVPARWAGHLLGLGARLARRRHRAGWQLIVAVSVPVHDYAAVLISGGWVLAQPGVRGGDILAEAQAIPSGTPVRMATAQRLVADRFYGIECMHGDPRIHVGGTFWKIDVVDHIVADPALPEERFGRVTIAQPGSLIKGTGHGATWPADQCASTPTVTLVGIRSRLDSELAIRAGWGGREGVYDRLRDILRPDEAGSAFCASAIHPGGREYLPDMPAKTKLAVLDGATAIRWLPEVRTPVVVALIDRSSTDESGGVAVLQRRSVGYPVQLDTLGWAPLPGVEALAFEVRI